MPILTSTGAVADVICAVCAVETHLVSTDWVTSADDPSVISTPPCVCGAVESFAWHDWTYVDPDGNPADSHDGAKQMVLIERIATAKGLTQAEHPEKTATPYASAPTAPTQTKVREYVAKLMGETP